MPKICDPPTYPTGQCLGLYIWGVQTIIYSEDGSIISNKTDGENSYGDYGKILGYKVRRYNTSGSYTRFQTIVDTSHGQYIMGDGVALTTSTVTIARLINLRLYSGAPDRCGDPINGECRCSADSCRVNCANAADGFCCIDHSITDRLLQVLAS